MNNHSRHSDVQSSIAQALIDAKLVNTFDGQIKIVNSNLVDLALLVNGPGSKPYLSTEAAHDGLVAHTMRIVNYRNKQPMKQKKDERRAWSRRSS